jgi:hypothetical protein
MNARLSDAGDLTVKIDERDLIGEVVLKERFVGRALQEILVCPSGGRPTVGFLHNHAGRYV